MNPCIPNIGPREQRRRMLLGVALLAITVIVSLIVVATGAPRLWRLPLFLPLWGAALGFFQARDKT